MGRWLNPQTEVSSRTQPQRSLQPKIGGWKSPFRIGADKRTIIGGPCSGHSFAVTFQRRVAASNRSVFSARQKELSRIFVKIYRQKMWKRFCSFTRISNWSTLNIKSNILLILHFFFHFKPELNFYRFTVYRLPFYRQNLSRFTVYHLPGKIGVGGLPFYRYRLLLNLRWDSPDR